MIAYIEEKISYNGDSTPILAPLNQTRTIHRTPAAEWERSRTQLIHMVSNSFLRHRSNRQAGLLLVLPFRHLELSYWLGILCQDGRTSCQGWCSLAPEESHFRRRGWVDKQSNQTVVGNQSLRNQGRLPFYY